MPNQLDRLAGGPRWFFPRHLFTGNRFPKQVFSNSERCFLFFEFSRAFGEGAWRLFVRLGNVYGDRAICFRCFEPDAGAYYLAHFGETAEFALAPSEEAHVYTSRMHEWPKSSKADALAYRADVVAWSGSSAQWAVWGERETNVAIVQLPCNERLVKELILLSDDYVPLVGLESALTDFVSNQLSTGEFVHFANEMRCHYVRR